jgi:hypothetical protein
MSHHLPDDTAQTAAATGADEIDAVRADIVAARTELSQAVDALSEKLDVKARAGEKVSAVTQDVRERAQRAKQAAPPQVQHALDVASEKAAPHRKELAIGAAAIALVLLIVQRRRGARS